MTLTLTLTLKVVSKKSESEFVHTLRQNYAEMVQKVAPLFRDRVRANQKRAPLHACTCVQNDVHMPQVCTPVVTNRTP